MNAWKDGLPPGREPFRPAWALAGPGQQNLLAGDSFDLFIGETPASR